MYCKDLFCHAIDSHNILQQDQLGILVNQEHLGDTLPSSLDGSTTINDLAYLNLDILVAYFFIFEMAFLTSLAMIAAPSALGCTPSGNSSGFPLVFW